MDNQTEPIEQRRGLQDMPSWVPRAAAVAVFTILAIAAALWVLVQVRSIILALFVALFLSFALEPAVVRLVRRGWKRPLATFAVFAVLVGFLFGFVAIMIPPVATQIGVLSERLPVFVESAIEFADDQFGIALTGDTILGWATGLADNASGYVDDVLFRVVGAGSFIGNFIVQVLSVLLFTYYLLADGPNIRRKLFARFEGPRQAEVMRIWELAIDKTGGYVYSRLMLALVSSIFSWIAFVIIGLPNPLSLGIWVGVISQFIPAVGAFIAASLPVAIGLLTDWRQAVAVLVVLVIYQQFENLFLAPRITSSTMSLHPAVGFAAVLAGISLMGALGAIVALPLVAIIQAFISAYFQEHEVVASRLTDDGLVERRRRSQPAAADSPGDPTESET